MEISTIICTHNPRPDYLRRVLDALKLQTLPKKRWELLLIDNASKEPLAEKWDLSWHPHARHIREEELGLTPARMRGIIECKGDFLVFVDDDNVLAAEYLNSASKLMISHTWVGAFGGSILGEFETKPESWAEVAIPYLAIRKVKKEEWALTLSLAVHRFVPYGAGMVLRKAVASHYLKMSANEPLRRGLGRKGSSLISSEDIDMALCSCDLGLAVGQFPQLELTHLIPTMRLNRDYLLRLAENIAFSNTVLQFIWSGNLPNPDQMARCRSEKILESYKSLRNWLRGGAPHFNCEFRAALDRGTFRAAESLQSRLGVPGAISD